MMRSISSRSILALLTALIVLWSGVGYMVWRERQRAIEVANRDITNLSLAFEEQSFWLLSTVEQLLRTVKYEAEHGGGAASDIAALLRRQSAPNEFAIQVSIVDKDGYLTASSLGLGEDATIVSYIERIHISVHIERDTGEVFIGPPIIGRRSGKWSLPITLRINNPDGSFGGVAVASVDPFYLSAYYRRLDLGQDGLVTLLGADAIIRARSGRLASGEGADEAGLGQTLSETPLFRLLPKAPSGVYESVSQIDKIERLLAYRTMRRYPLVAIVGRSKAEVLAPWWRLAQQTFIGTIVASFGFFAFFYLLSQEGRRRVEQARSLAEANRLLRLAEQVANVGHWRLEVPTRSLTWSDELYRIHGLTKEHFVPDLERAIAAYHPEDRVRIKELISKAIHMGRGFEFNFRIVRPDGEVRNIMTRGLVEFDIANKPMALFGAITDITERIRQEEALREARQEAETAAKAKADFLATVSHELRTPLNAVIGFADLLLTGSLPEHERRHYIRLQAEAGRALLSVINDVLDFSKIDAGRLDLEEVASDAIGLFQTCADLVRPMILEKGLNLKVKIEDDLPPWLLLDPARMRQIVLNLLNNAAKFTQAGGITLSAGRIADDAGMHWLRIAVEDTGIGIATERQPLLFEPFHQADASTARRYGGTGLGLAICKRLATLMGGRVGLHSQLGKGSLFWVEVPLHTAPAPEATAHLPVPAAAGTDKPTRPLFILVAEDLPMNQVLVRAILERAGHRVDIVADGAAALAATHQNAYDIVLMDVQMPGMDGLEATRAIRALPPPKGRLPIVALTANALSAEVERCHRAGMDGHIAKPIEAEHLIAVLARWSQRLGPVAGKADERRQDEGDKESAGSALLEQARAVTEEGQVEAAPRSHAAPVIQDAMLDQLESLMGSATLASMLAEVSVTLRNRLETITAPDVNQDMIRANAHAMISLAGNFGLMEMSHASRALEAICDNPDSAPIEYAQGLETLRQALARAQVAVADKIRRWS
jgi:PAS domain S-box-containing protein